MRKTILLFIALITLCSIAFPILNGNFDLGEAFWTKYYTGSGSVAFYPDPFSYVRILALNGTSGIWQQETGFTSGEWKATFTITNISTGLNALVTIGWTDISGDFAGFYQEINSNGTYTVNCNNSNYRYVTVQCDASWIVSAIVEVDTITTQQVGGDSNPPTYGVGVPPGIQAVYRTDANTAAQVTWSPATDNSTPSNQIKYNVYCAETAGAVFTTPFKTVTFVGALTGLVDGFDPTKAYYFGVRAEDQATNEETNTVVLSASPQTDVPNPVWNLYE